ncbi:hypothetical protein QTP88_014763 [Uroleucon formosanum]
MTQQQRAMFSEAAHFDCLQKYSENRGQTTDAAAGPLVGQSDAIFYPVGSRGRRGGEAAWSFEKSAANISYTPETDPPDRKYSNALTHTHTHTQTETKANAMSYYIPHIDLQILKTCGSPTCLRDVQGIYASCILRIIYIILSKFDKYLWNLETIFHMKNDFVASTIRNHHHHQMSGNYEAIDLGLLCETRSVRTHYISFPDEFISDTSVFIDIFTHCSDYKVLSYNSRFAASVLQQSAFMGDMAYDRVSESVTETAWTVKKP